MLNSPAPEFALEASTGQKINLTDLFGSYTVLIFYPANDTPVCNRQLEDMSIKSKELVARNARIFGVNTASPSKHREYCTRKQLEFPILSDPGGTTAKKFKAFWGWMGINRRTVVVIEPKGLVIFYQRGNPKPIEILAAIEQHSKVIELPTA